MDRDRILRLLQQRQAELRQDGVQRLALFGSAARGEAGEMSDVDLLADFDDQRVRTLLDIVKIEGKLARILGTPVNLAERRAVRAALRPHIEAELVTVF